MPGPEAKTEYHCVAFFTLSDLPKFLAVILASSLPTRESSPNRPPQLAFIAR